MHKFSIEEMYKKVAKIDVLRNDTNSVIRHSAGFFYCYNENIFFVTKREHIIIEEKMFLPDSLVLYPNIEAKTSGVNALRCNYMTKTKSLPGDCFLHNLKIDTYLFLSKVELRRKALYSISSQKCNFQPMCYCQ